MIKDLWYIAILGLGLSSCSALRPVSSAPAAKSGKVSQQFIENIKVNPAEAPAATATVYKKNTRKSIPAFHVPELSVTESLTSLQFKYGVMMNVAVEKLTNLKLLETIDDWYGSRYRYGGTTKKGVDCSALTCAIMGAVFGTDLPRTARQQYAASERITKDELQEGDLVFFNTTGGISHVGIYLENNKFVHASSSSGVMISDLDETYFRRKYIGAGRVL